MGNKLLAKLRKLQTDAQFTETHTGEGAAILAILSKLIDAMIVEQGGDE